MRQGEEAPNGFDWDFYSGPINMTTNILFPLEGTTLRSQFGGLGVPADPTETIPPPHHLIPSPPHHIPTSRQPTAPTSHRPKPPEVMIEVKADPLGAFEARYS